MSILVRLRSERDAAYSDHERRGKVVVRSPAEWYAVWTWAADIGPILVLFSDDSPPIPLSRVRAREKLD